MDLSRILRERQQQIMRSSRIKLVAMVVLFLILILVMLELSRVSRQPEEAHGARPTGEAEDEGEKQESRVDTKGATELPPGERPDFAPVPVGRPQPKLAASKEDIEKKLPFLTDPKTLEQVTDQNADLEPGPLFYVLYQVFQDTPDKLRAEAEKVAEWMLLWDKAAAYRNKPLRVSGELVRTWEQPLGENPMGITKLYAYRLRAENAPPTSKGHLYDVYSIEKLRGALRYDKLAAFGRFLKAQLAEAERLDDPDLHTAVLIARSIEPPTYLDEPHIPGPLVDGNRTEARPLYWLLKRAKSVPFEELRAKANRNLTYLDFVNRPERYRARPVAVSGQLRRLVRINLPENLLGMTDVFYGQIADRDRHMNTFYCIDVPEGIHDGDPVVLYGYFLKKWTYTSEGGYEVQSPVIVAKSLLVLDYEGVGSGRPLQVGLGIIVAVTAIALGFAIVAAHRKDRQAAEARRQRESARIQARLRPSEKAQAPKQPEEPSQPA